jgi:hypothetical protein
MSLPPDPNAVPHEGEEGSAPALPPQRYEGGQPAPKPAPTTYEGGQPDAPKPAPTTLDRLEAVSGPLAFALFMLSGFLLDGWAWSWIFFLLPGIVYTWNRTGRHD